MTAAPDIATEWAAIARRRADRADDALAHGKATQAQADHDAALCDLITRHLLRPITVDHLMAMHPAQVNALADAAELFDRVTKPRHPHGQPGERQISDALRRASIGATLATVGALSSVHYAMMALGVITRAPANGYPLRWRIPCEVAA